MRRLFLFLLLGIAFGQAGLSAQDASEPADSLVRLLSAQKARLIEKNGRNYREVTGDVRFLHNNTYLHCDTALWNVKGEYIDAIGNVKIIQENTILSGDKLHYLIQKDLAQFRGTLVELLDKDRNCLRTKNLDYNTRDSIATFWGGGCMKDKDGNLIESQRGQYDSKISQFTFSRRVQMFSDSLFLVTDSLRYFSDRDFAEFKTNTRGWRNNNYMEADAGWYNRAEEQLYFEKDVYVRTPEYEVWCERLHYDRNQTTSLLEDRVRILDTASHAAILSDRLLYDNSRQYAEVTHNPAVIYYGQNEEGVVDTLFMAADTLIYQQLRMYQIDSAVVQLAHYRRGQALMDPVGAAAKKQERPSNQRQAPQAGNNGPANGAPANAGPGNARPANTGSGNARPANTPPRGTTQGANSQVSRPRPGSNGDFPQTVRSNGPRFVDMETWMEQDSMPKRRRPNGLGAPGAQAGPGVQGGPGAQGGRTGLTGPGRSNNKGMMDSLLMRPPVRDTLPARDTLPVRDTLLVRDTMAVAAADTTQVEVAPQAPKDTTQVIFLKAYRNVRLYRSDFQAICDSLEYLGIDSIARLYRDPVLWNDVTNQLTADSMQLVVENGQLSKGIMKSNAYLVSQQDTLFYNQIKGAEMIGYFRDNELYRFDALGGASALFFLAEDSCITTMNQKESTMMSSWLKDNTIERSIYMSGVKNDFFPVVDLSNEQKFMRDFQWRPEDRPEDRHAITDACLPESERDRRVEPFFPKFRNAEIYFTGYIPGILREIKVRDSLSRLPRKPDLFFDIDTVATYLPEIEQIKEESVLKAPEKAKEKPKSQVNKGDERKKQEEVVYSDKPVRREPPVLKNYPLKTRRDTTRYEKLAEQYEKLATVMDTIYVLQDSLYRSAETMYRDDVRYVKRVIRYYERQERKIRRSIERKERRLLKRLDLYVKPEEEK